MSSVSNEYQGKLFVTPVKNVKAGVTLVVDSAFTCVDPYSKVLVENVEGALCFRCSQGYHDLEGQEDDTGENYIGVLIAE